MSDYYMLKDYKKEGRDLKSFLDEAVLIDDHTIIKEVPTDMATAFFCYAQILSSSSIQSLCQVVFDGSVYPDSAGGFERVEKLIFDSSVNLNAPERQLLLELKENFLINFEGDYCKPQENFFIDDVAIKTLAARLSIRQGLLKKDNYTKALFITSGFSDLESTIIVYRTNGTYNRIISFVGNKYKRNTLLSVYNIAKEAEKYFLFDKWSCSNLESVIQLKYKDYLVKISVTDTCEFADNISVYLKKNLDYKLLSKPIADIKNIEECMKTLKESIDKMDALLSTVKDYESLENSVVDALGVKSSKLALSYIKAQDNYIEAALEIPDLIELSDNQKKEYSNILFKVLGEKLCA